MKGNSFEIKPGQKVSPQGVDFSITFVSVVEDSRCPRGVQCIWPGNVKITLTLSERDCEDAEVRLNTYREPRTIRHRGRDIKITGVEPPKLQDKRIRPEDYVVTLEISGEQKAAPNEAEAHDGGES